MGRRRDLDAHTYRLGHRKAAMETRRYEPVKRTPQGDVS